MRNIQGGIYNYDGVYKIVFFFFTYTVSIADTQYSNTIRRHTGAVHMMWEAVSGAGDSE